MGDQKGLEAVAEALTSRECVVRFFPGDEIWVEGQLSNIEAALAASRQPVSGGPEGDVREATIVRVLGLYIASDRLIDNHLAEPLRRSLAKEILAALSRVPADGDGSAQWRCPYCSRPNALTERTCYFCSRACPVPADGEQPADPRMAATLDAVDVREGVRCVEMPCCGFTFAADHVDVGTEWLYSCPLCSSADGPVSAFRPPEAGYEQVGNINFPGESLEAGLGDRQLTAEDADALCKHLDVAQGHKWLDLPSLKDVRPKLEAIRRLASGENPDA